MRKIHNKINYMVFLFKLHNAKLFVLFIHDVNTKCSSIVLPKYKMGSETLPETTEARFVSLVIVTIRVAKISIGKSFAVFSVDIEFWNDKVKNTIFSVNQVQCDFLHRHIRSIFLCDTNHGHFYCLTSFTQTNHEQMHTAIAAPEVKLRIVQVCDTDWNDVLWGERRRFMLLFCNGWNAKATTWKSVCKGGTRSCEGEEEETVCSLSAIFHSLKWNVISVRYFRRWHIING